MIFYIVLGGLFSLYGLDLLALVVISAIARGAEIKAAMQKRRQAKKQQRALEDGMNPGQVPCAKFAFGNESIVNGLGMIHTKPDLTAPAAANLAKQQQPQREASPASPPSTPLAPACPLPNQRLHATISNASSYTDLAPATGTDIDDAPSAPPLPGATADSGHHRVASAGSAGSSSSATAVSHQCTGSSPPVLTAVSIAKQQSPLAQGAVLPNTAANNLSLIIRPPCYAPVPGTFSTLEPLATGAVPSIVPGRLNSIPSCASSVLTDGCSSTFDGQSISGTALRPLPSKSHMYTSSGSSLPSSGGSQTITMDMLINAELGEAAPKLQTAQDKRALDFTAYKPVPGNCEDWPLPLEQYPLVLIQLPMFNEEAHCALIVERCCQINWPRTRLLIQVLDDSTKAHIRDKLDRTAVAYMEKGHPIQVLRRTNRQGYKAGAMVEGLEHVKALGFKYVAIFDADFEPPKDFLLETIGPLEGDDKLGFVQTRWLNPSKSFLTWAQKVNLGFHFDVEQRARSYMGWFFNFNGTAGVWRVQAIETSGGWESDTVVEDMDLSLRAYLTGWRGLYLPHVGCTNEVPDDLSTYKTQQYRWLCGPMQILSKAFLTIWRSDNVPLRLRLNCYWFFARYILFAVITLSVLAVPPVALWVDPWKWSWPTIYFCVAVNFALAVYLYVTPFSIAYLLFSVAVGYFKAWAMLGGLFGSKKSKSWKVTAKKGAQDGPQSMWQRIKSTVSNIGLPYALESGLALYYGALCVLACLAIGLPGPSWLMGAYCGFMSLIFLVLGFGDAFL